MYFMNGEFTEADKIFGESFRQELSRSESHIAHFFPRDPTDRTGPIRVEGKVGDVRSGFAYLDSQHYPKIFCPGSMFGGIRMAKGVRVSFEICFSARGPIADRLRSN
jgi:hypothetical protein